MHGHCDRSRVIQGTRPKGTPTDLATARVTLDADGVTFKVETLTESVTMRTATAGEGRGTDWAGCVPCSSVLIRG